MITPDDIKLLVASGEGYNAEFKVSVPSKVKEIAIEVCAFANAAGGVLLIGVNDAGKLTGVNIDNGKRSAIQNSLGEISPHLSCTLTFVEVEGKSIGVIEVPSGANKPYVLSGAIYVRIGPNTQKLTTAEQMRDFFQQSEKIYFDEAACKSFSIPAMLDNDFLPVFKLEAKISGAVPDEQLFRSLKLFTSEDSFKNGAVLFFGKNPEKLIDTAVLRCLAFKGMDKRFIADDQVFGGNLYNQFQGAMVWLRSKLNVHYDIEGQGAGPRKEIWEIPETVFKEVIVNSLTHRDYYDKGSVINIEVFEDRVEISNPGGLVSAIPVTEFGKRSHSRNPLIFGLFARMHLVEQVGSGISRIKELMIEADLPEPVFQMDGIFTVILKRQEKTTEKLSEKLPEKTSDKIMYLIQQNSEITLNEIAVLLEISISTVERNIRLFKRQKMIERIGTNKKGYWKVMEKSKGK